MMQCLNERLPSAWRPLLKAAVETDSFLKLNDFVLKEYAEEQIFPPYHDLFSAFELTPPERVKVVILGQDPYHDDGQAHGLAFSVRPGIKFPASLRNIFKEYQDDLGLRMPSEGSLIPWAMQGVLLLNTVLTVRAHAANSHAKHGWEDFTDSVISAINAFDRPVIFVLWGAPAQKKQSLITNPKHHILCSAHPSPLSAYRGFFGSKPFSGINEFLRADGLPEIDWKLPSAQNHITECLF